MITASVGLVAAVAGLAATILGLLNRKKIQQVHVLVNSQLTQVLERVAQLSASMTEAGVTIPPPPPPPQPPA